MKTVAFLHAHGTVIPRDDDFLRAFPDCAQDALERVRALVLSMGDQADADNIGSALQYAAWALKGTIDGATRDRLFIDLLRTVKRGESLSDPRAHRLEIERRRAAERTASWAAEPPPNRAAEPPEATDEENCRTYGEAPLMQSPAWAALREKAAGIEKEYGEFIEPVLYDAANRFGAEKPAAVFVESAKALVDYEPSTPDSYRAAWETGPRIVSYASLEKAQCLHYFAWRAKWREGLRRLDSMLNARLYFTELANRVRGESPEAAYGEMKQFVKDVAELPATFDSLAAQRSAAWRPFTSRVLNDFACYYGLPPDEPSSAEPDPVRRILNFREEGGETVLASVYSLAKSVGKSRFSIDNPDLMRRAFLTLFAVLDEAPRPAGSVLKVLRGIPQDTLLTAALGDWSIAPAKLFAGMIFLDVDRSARLYVKNRAEGRIRTDNGFWYDYILFAGAADGRFEALAKRLEAKLRAAKGARPIKSQVLSAPFEDALDRTIKRLQQAERDAANPAGAIDWTALSSIRTDAQTIEAKLTAAVEDPDSVEPDDGAALEAAPAQTTPAFEAALSTPLEPAAGAAGASVHLPPGVPAPESPGESAVIDLNPAEIRYLQALLARDAAAVDQAARALGQSHAMLVDQLNGKLFDLAGDNLLRLEGGRAALEEDYESDLSAFLAARGRS